MKRRTFAELLVAGSFARPFEARAQSAARVWRIGVLEAIPEDRNARNLEALRSELRRLGYVEGRNLRIEYRSADGRPERFRDLALDLVRLEVDVILSRGTPGTLAAAQATSSIPVVMTTMGAPQAVVVGFGGAGSNVTGVTTFSTELTAKRLELLKELAPRVSRVALIHNMTNPAAPAEWQAMQQAARALHLQIQLFDVSDERALVRAADRAATAGIDGAVVGADGLMQAHPALLVDALNARKLIASYPGSEFVEVGGLMAYAVNYRDLYTRLAGIVDKIIKGTKPSEIPVEGPTKFELAINLKTARLLGLKVPGSLVLRADRLIE